MSRGEMTFVRAAGLLAGGFVIWAAHFLFVYGWTGLACARPAWGWTDRPFGAVQLGVLIASLGAGAALVALAAATLRTPNRFVGQAGFAVASLALLAIVWEAASALLMPTCQ